jgi:DNA-binding transcriptional ArsR family regulator
MRLAADSVPFPFYQGGKMSTKLTGYVWDACAAAGMKLSSVAIMARLADFSSDEGVCWPSIATIARQIGAGESTVRTAIAKLEKEGWLTRKQRRQGNRNASNVYQLNVAKLQTAAFSHLSESDASNPDASKADASESDPSKSDASESGKNSGSDPSESGGDPSVTSNHDPSDKKPSCPDASLSDDENTDEFLVRHPEAVVYSPKKRQWGTAEDLKAAKWIHQKIIRLYEKAAEYDGEIARPAEPNWTAWANDIRLMRQQDGRSHRQICEMYDRVNHDPFWCKNILSPSKLREKWDDLVLRLSPVTPSVQDGAFRSTYSGVDYSAVPEGFRT